LLKIAFVSDVSSHLNIGVKSSRSKRSCFGAAYVTVEDQEVVIYSVVIMTALVPIVGLNHQFAQKRVRHIKRAIRVLYLAEVQKQKLDLLVLPRRNSNCWLLNG